MTKIIKSRIFRLQLTTRSLILEFYILREKNRRNAFSRVLKKSRELIKNHPVALYAIESYEIMYKSFTCSWRVNIRTTLMSTNRLFKKRFQNVSTVTSEVGAASVRVFVPFRIFAKFTLTSSAWMLFVAP